MFSPDVRSELKTAVDICLAQNERGECSNEDGPIADWDISKIKDADSLFYNKPDFNMDISKWDVSKVTTMVSMFRGCLLFKSDISNWDVSNVQSMGRMFKFAQAFNSDISKWDVSSVTYMYSMFHHSSVFQADLSSWDVSKVATMNAMFESAERFNAAIGLWNVSNVQNFQNMFKHAKSFNADISGWDVRTDNMAFMFNGATCFLPGVDDAKKIEIFEPNTQYQVQNSSGCRMPSDPIIEPPRAPGPTAPSQGNSTGAVTTKNAGGGNYSTKNNDDAGTTTTKRVSLSNVVTLDAIVAAFLSSVLALSMFS